MARLEVMRRLCRRDKNIADTVIRQNPMTPDTTLSLAEAVVHAGGYSQDTDQLESFIAFLETKIDEASIAKQTWL